MILLEYQSIMAKYDMNAPFEGFESELGQRIIDACLLRGEESEKFVYDNCQQWDESHRVITNQEAWKLLSRLERSYPIISKAESSTVDNNDSDEICLFG